MWQIILQNIKILKIKNKVYVGAFGQYKWGGKFYDGESYWRLQVHAECEESHQLNIFACLVPLLCILCKVHAH